MNEPVGEIHLFGHKLPVEKERKFILFAAGIGIVGVIFAVIKAKRDAAAQGIDPGTGQSADPTTGGTSTGGGTDTGGTATTTNPADLYQDVEFGFSFDRGVGVEAEKGEKKGQSGSGGISFGPFSFGGGGSSSKTTTTHIKTDAANKFNVNTKVHGDAATINGVESFLTNLAGTFVQNQELSLEQLQAANQYLGGTGISPYVPKPPGLFRL